MKSIFTRLFPGSAKKPDLVVNGKKTPAADNREKILNAFDEDKRLKQSFDSISFDELEEEEEENVFIEQPEEDPASREDNYSLAAIATMPRLKKGRKGGFLSFGRKKAPPQEPVLGYGSLNEAKLMSRSLSNLDFDPEAEQFQIANGRHQNAPFQRKGGIMGPKNVKVPHAPTSYRPPLPMPPAQQQKVPKQTAHQQSSRMPAPLRKKKNINTEHMIRSRSVENMDNMYESDEFLDDLDGEYATRVPGRRDVVKYRERETALLQQQNRGKSSVNSNNSASSSGFSSDSLSNQDFLAIEQVRNSRQRGLLALMNADKPPVPPQRVESQEDPHEEEGEELYDEISSPVESPPPKSVRAPNNNHSAMQKPPIHPAMSRSKQLRRDFATDGPIFGTLPHHRHPQVIAQIPPGFGTVPRKPRVSRNLAYHPRYPPLFTQTMNRRPSAIADNLSQTVSEYDFTVPRRIQSYIQENPAVFQPDVIYANSLQMGSPLDASLTYDSVIVPSSAFYPPYQQQRRRHSEYPVFTTSVGRSNYTSKAQSLLESWKDRQRNSSGSQDVSRGSLDLNIYDIPPPPFESDSEDDIDVEPPPPPGFGDSPPKFRDSSSSVAQKIQCLEGATPLASPNKVRDHAVVQRTQRTVLPVEPAFVAPGQSGRPDDTWTVDEVVVWLDSLSLNSYKSVFSDNAIDGAALLSLDNRDFSELGVLVGHRKRIEKALNG